jgi:hypothetical protein
MNFTKLPLEKLVTDTGHISESWRVCLQQLVSQLQNNVSNEGYITPHQDVGVIGLLNKVQKEGAVLYNSTNKAPMFNMPVARGTFPTFSTAYEFSTMNTYHQMNNDEITNIPTDQRNGKFIFNSTDNALYVGFNNTIKKVTTT